MTIDSKIISKILVSKNQQYSKRIIHHDQVGYYPGVQGWSDMHKSINVMEYINKMKDKNMIVSMDAEKKILQIQHVSMIKKTFKQWVVLKWIDIFLK